MARRSGPAPARDCVECGASFQPMKVDGKFCSGACRQRSSRLQRDTSPVLVVPRPDSHDLAWAAGFIDGEGCIRASYNGAKIRYLYLTVGQKNRPLVDKLIGIFGVGSIHHSPARPTSSEAHVWTCTSRRAFHGLSLVWPWLGEQKKADFKRAIKSVHGTRQALSRHPQRGKRIVMEGGQ